MYICALSLKFPHWDHAYTYIWKERMQFIIYLILKENWFYSIFKLLFTKVSIYLHDSWVQVGSWIREQNPQSLKGVQKRNRKNNQKDSDDFWHWNLTCKVSFMHFSSKNLLPGFPCHQNFTTDIMLILIYDKKGCSL